LFYALSPSQDEEDIVDEAIKAFRCNVLFTKFDKESPADLTLCYLTVYISECLRKFANYKTKSEAERKITQLSHSQNFTIPGEKGFCLGGFFSQPASRSEADLLRSYFRQLREETATRLLDHCYLESGEQNKWWIQFKTRKFMNIDRT